MIIVGCQWGDEGKGKVVDFLAQDADMVVRYQGGANAGHTLIVDGKKTILHLIPSGILNPSCLCVIASGVVLDLEILTNEISLLQTLPKDKNLLISSDATLLLPFHKTIDLAREVQNKIGTTKRGIGPAYEDRVSRNAIVFRDIFHPSTLKDKLAHMLKEKNALLEFYKKPKVDINSLYEELLMYAEKLESYTHDNTSKLIHEYKQKGKKIIFEGAQGTMLDPFHGTYPYVTSSSTIAGAACIYAGIGPTKTDKILGVIKAYCTRVGSGPFPSELKCKIGDRIGIAGNEFGATTNRKRRCGWLDLVALSHAVRVNGITSLAITKLDTLSGFETVSVVTQYEINGKKTSDFPLSPGKLSNAKPILKSFSGWKEIRNGLCDNAKSFLDFISKYTNVRVKLVGTGPGRRDVIFPFD